MSSNKAKPTAVDDQEEETESLPRYEGEERTVGSIKEMLATLKENSTSRVKKTAAKTGALLAAITVVASGEAAAVHTGSFCRPPDELQPLFELLHSLAELAFIAGVGLAVIGFMTAALMIIVPGEEWTRRGKSVAKSTFLGTILLLSANMLVSWLIVQFGSTIC